MKWYISETPGTYIYIKFSCMLINMSDFLTVLIMVNLFPSNWVLVRSSKAGTRVCWTCVSEKKGSWPFPPPWDTVIREQVCLTVQGLEIPSPIHVWYRAQGSNNCIKWMLRSLNNCTSKFEFVSILSFIIKCCRHVFKHIAMRYKYVCQERRCIVHINKLIRILKEHWLN